MRAQRVGRYITYKNEGHRPDLGRWVQERIHFGHSKLALDGQNLAAWLYNSHGEHCYHQNDLVLSAMESGSLEECINL